MTLLRVNFFQGKTLTKSLRNVYSAVLSSQDRIATVIQQQQINNTLIQMNALFEQISGVEEKLNEIIGQIENRHSVQNLVGILKDGDVNLYEDWKKQKIRSLGIKCCYVTPFAITKATSVDDLDQYFKVIWTYISEEGKSTCNNVSSENMPIIQQQQIIESATAKSLHKDIYNEYLQECWNKDEFVSSRYEFAKRGGMLFRNALVKEWEHSPHRAYINALLKNLNEYSDFDILSTENVFLRSFAAFCQKGELEIEKLENHLVQCEIFDYRYAFALWGIVFGFADMPKTLTNCFYQNSDRKYVSDIYAFIHKQLFNEEIGSAQTPIISQINGAKEDVEEDVVSSTANIIQQSTDIKDEIRTFVNGLSRIKEELKKSLESILDKWDGMDIKDFLSQLKQAGGWMTKSGKPSAFLEKVQQKYLPEHDERETSVVKKQVKKAICNTGKQSTIPFYDECDNASSNRLIDNTRKALELIETTCLAMNDKCSFKKLLSRFLKEYQPPKGYYYLHASQYRQNNMDVIDHFGKWCFAKKRNCGNLDPNPSNLNSAANISIPFN